MTKREAASILKLLFEATGVEWERAAKRGRHGLRSQWSILRQDLQSAYINLTGEMPWPTPRKKRVR